jgi:hypothetical protein
MIARVKRMWQILKDRNALKQCYRNIFATPEGEIVLRDIIRIGCVAKPTYCRGDQYETAFQEGRRHLALTILHKVCKDETELQKLIEEGATDDNPLV